MGKRKWRQRRGKREVHKGKGSGREGETEGKERNG